MTDVAFGTDGWRGVVGDDFTYANVRLVAQGIANFLEGDTRPIVVGHDPRFSAELFSQEVARVLAANGKKVLLLDKPIPTPAICWTVVERGAAGGVVVTASHNPPEFNGIKFKSEVGGSASETDVAGIEQGMARAETDGIKTCDFKEAVQEGSVELIDGIPGYFQELERVIDFNLIKQGNFRIFHDAMYGSGMLVYNRLAQGRFLVEGFHQERNPIFPGIHPEPIQENLGQTIHYLASHPEFAIGIANDGDADRLGVIDPLLGYVDSLEVLSLFTMYLLEKKGLRDPIVRSISESTRVDALGEAYGVPVFESPVGFKYTSKTMLEKKAMLAGEESGSYAFLSHIPERDGVMAGLMMMEMMSAYGQGLTKLRCRLATLVGTRAYARRDIRFPREGYGLRKEKIRKLLGEFTPEKIAGVEVDRVSTLDGFKFYLKNGAWVLVRMSGTEPLMRVYCEAPTAGERDVVLEEMVKLA